MIRYNSLVALRIVLAHRELAISKLSQLIAGRALPIVANTIVRPAVDELVDCGLVEIFDRDGIRMISASPLGLRYAQETEMACEEAA